MVFAYILISTDKWLLFSMMIFRSVPIYYPGHLKKTNPSNNQLFDLNINDSTLT